MEHFTNGFLGVVAVAALRSVAFAAVAGFLLSVMRVKNVALRLTVWKVVLWGALAMPLLAWALPSLHVELPRVITAVRAFRTNERAYGIRNPQRNSEFGNGIAANRVNVPRRKIRQQRRSATQRSSASQRSRGAALNFAAQSPATVRNNQPKLAQLQIGAASARESRSPYISQSRRCFPSDCGRLDSGPAPDSRRDRHSRSPRGTKPFAARISRGLRETPPLAESEAVTVPVTLGVARPVILLPSDWREWDDDKLNAVLAHELSHVGRHDALTLRLAKIHRAIYWFSPLAWYLDREFARLAEEASDEAALAGGANRERYAEILLRFFEAVRAGSGRVWWHGVSMAAAGDAAKRVDRILSWKGAVTMRLQKTFVAALAVIALPVLVAAASIQITHARGSELRSLMRHLRTRPIARLRARGGRSAPIAASATGANRCAHAAGSSAGNRDRSAPARNHDATRMAVR